MNNILKLIKKIVRFIFIKRPIEKIIPLKNDPYKKNDFYFIGMKKTENKDI